MNKKGDSDWKQLVVTEIQASEGELLDRVFKSPAFKSFLNVHTINYSKADKQNLRLQPVCNQHHIETVFSGHHYYEATAVSDSNNNAILINNDNNTDDIQNEIRANKNANELCVHSAVDIGSETVVLPYTGVFVSSESGMMLPSHCALMPETQDRDMRVEWKRFDGATGGMLGQYKSILRGWDVRLWEKPTNFIKRRSQWASFLNHRCLKPSCEFVVVDVYVFLPSNQAPWLVFSSATKKNARGQKILENGMLRPHRTARVPPTIPLQFEGEVVLFGWPVIETLRPISKNEELTVNYGSDFVATSPYHCDIIEAQCDATVSSWWNIAKKNNGEYCWCVDCIALPDPRTRSVFCK
jgi:hypothetical protein